MNYPDFDFEDSIRINIFLTNFSVKDRKKEEIDTDDSSEEKI